ncbi:MAG: S41 family peptidase, partial [Phycisphaerales bacterium]
HLPTFDAIDRLVVERFFDAELNGLDWDALRAEHRALAHAAPDDAAFAVVMNDLLALLNASHTAYIAPDDPRNAELLDIFRFAHADLIAERYGEGGVRVDTIGARFERFDAGAGWFVVDLVPGAPAERAGLLVGDEVVAADGAPFRPGRSFAGRAGDELTLTIRRDGPAAATRAILVRPILASPHELLRDSIDASARVIECDGRRLGYVRIYSWAGAEMQEAFVAALAAEPIASADGLVLDIRGGWGGASAGYLDVFNADAVPPTTMTLRDREPIVIDDRWRKPVVLLIDGGSRSGKEMVAFGFKRAGLGPVVGEMTAGAVLAGSVFPLPDGGLLYLAVGDVTIAGERLEGVGVEPDIPVKRPIPYSGGADPQLDAAIGALLNEIR